MSDGTGFVDITPDMLGIFLEWKPTSYRVIGSEASPYDGVVRLVIESSDIKGHGHQLDFNVSAQGTMRTVSFSRIV